MKTARKKCIAKVPRTLTRLDQVLEEYKPLSGIYKGRAEGADGSECLIFMHDDMVEPLSKCTQLFSDGTFRVK